MSEVSFEVTRTRIDVFKALVANMLRSPGALVWFVVGSLFVAGIAAAVNDTESLPVRTIIFGVAFLAMLVLYAVIMLVCIYFAARKSWTAPGGLAPIKFNLSAAGLAASTETAHGQSGWDNWKSAFETRDLIVIRHHLGLLQIIPKRTLPVDAIARVRDVLRANIKGRVRLAASVVTS